MSEPRRLWDKGEALDARIHRFTVGDDPALDRELLHWDCLGSAAHVRTLQRAGLLTADETASLLGELAAIDARARAGRFDISPEQEDCHTAIENHLAQRCGPAGQKVHTGRSRNDQVAAAMRLFMRHHALRFAAGLEALIAELLGRLAQDGGVRMPGYTHMQPAMPSSVGQWLHAHAEAALEQLRAVEDLLTRLDSCPLGTGAGFGVGLPLDREYTARLLGFARAQRSPIDVQNSRGRLETYFARVAADVAAIIEKLACDLLIYTGPPYGFFELPAALTTGSSIMPQKRNPDVLELMRGWAGRLRARVVELEWVRGKLPSSYHRDLQLTKAPTLQAAAGAQDLLEVGAAVMRELAVRKERLAAAMSDELYATDAAYALVRRGVPFREAYARIGEQVRAGVFRADAGARAGAAGLVDERVLSELRADVAEAAGQIARIRERVDAAEGALLNCG
ncbi:MAG: argininosuccinate lyase [Phycisphaerae bacterium]|nr:argininosuccinate lyase [Phycisphaerae bacterium]MCZ2400947.1 argininosuccinate lyase [Phycisphaerae bacterium]